VLEFVWCIAGGTPRHRSGRGDNAGHSNHGAAIPVHVCTVSPEAVRDEVETLKTDFNGRVTQILFDSMLCAYYMGCVPLCFAQVVYIQCRVSELSVVIYCLLKTILTVETNKNDCGECWFATSVLLGCFGFHY